MTQREEFLSQRQATLRYGINARTLARRRQDGRLPMFIDPLHDKLVLYRRADIEALLHVLPAEEQPLAERSGV